MTNTFALPRKLIIFGIIIPLAAILGYLLATPYNFSTIALVGITVGTLSIPLLMKWHHPLLVFTWNASMTVFFLPGQPELWMLMAAISLGFVILNRTMTREQSFVFEPSVVIPLLFIALVVLVTMKLTGGIGLRSLGGSTYGGKRYFYILTAVLGFFALIGQRIPLHRATLYSTLFFLSALTGLVSNLAYYGGPSFYFLYYIFPATLAFGQAAADYIATGANFSRLTGLAFAAPALYNILLLRYGLQGVLAPSKIWRLLIFCAVLVMAMLGGFRSSILMAGLLCGALFLLEKLFRTRLVLVGALGIILGGGALIPMAKHLPLAMQRSLSFLPIEVDPRAEYDARISTEWRLKMWSVLVPQIPQYFWRGKGYGMDPTEFYLLEQNARRWFSQFETDLTIASGSYHSGPLTLIIPLGIWGMIGFLWFAIASLRILHRNYAYGPPELKRINTFLLAYFSVRFVYFLFIYGQFAEDLFNFTGLIGLSLSLNGRVKKPRPGDKVAPAEENLVETPAGQLVGQT